MVVTLTSMPQIAAFAIAVLVVTAAPNLLVAEGSTARLTATGAQPRAAAPDASVPARLRSVIAKTVKVDENKVTATTAFVKDSGADEVMAPRL